VTETVSTFAVLQELSAFIHGEDICIFAQTVVKGSDQMCNIVHMRIPCICLILERKGLQTICPYPPDNVIMAVFGCDPVRSFVPWASIVAQPLERL